MLELSAVFMLLTFVVFVGYGLFAAVDPRPRDLAPAGADVDAPSFAGAFAALGAKLVLAGILPLPPPLVVVALLVQRRQSHNSGS